MARKPTIGKAEYSLLAYVAGSDCLSVGEIHAHFETRYGYSRSTVTQMLERLRRKGFLTRSKVEGKFVYRSPRPLSEIQSEMVDDLVSEVLDGSAAPLLHFFQRKVKLTKAEEAEIKRILDRIDRSS